MKSLISLVVRILKYCLYNTPVRNWRLTAYIYGKVGSVLIGTAPFPVVECMGVKLKTNGADTSVTTPLINGHYEGYTLEVLHKLIQEKIEKRPLQPLIFADIGANIGVFTVIAAAKNPSIRVYAFEPNPMSFNILKENLSLNCLNNVTAINSAVGSSSGTASLDVSSRCAGTHSLYGNGLTRLEVPLISLDEFFIKAKAAPDLIKIDVEGYEPTVLRGMETLLKKKPLQVILEFHPKWLKRGNQDPAAFLSELTQSFDAIYCLDELRKEARRYATGNLTLERQILSVGFNLLLIRGEIPAFLEKDEI